MFELPFPIPKEKRDKNGNIICYVRLNGNIEYVQSLENYKIDFESNNTVIIYEGESTPKRIVIGMRRKNLLILKRSKYKSKISISFKDNSKCYIGEDSSFVDAYLHLREGKNIYIGNDCQFSTGIYIWNSDAHSILDKDGNPINHAEDVYIGDHVWVCQHCQILKGTYINSNSVIGSMSIVNKKFNQKNVIIAGNPAKIVKSDIGGWSRAAPSLFEKHKLSSDK